MQNFIGKQIDRYRILSQQGLGGMAVVYKAYDTRLERDVALKLIRTESIPADQHDRLLLRFEREAKAQARFSHPHIVPVYDYGDVNGSPYLVFEYVPGGTLKEKIIQPVSVQKAIDWIKPIASALQYAHERKVIHRDIKPSNILFDETGRPMLTDFGIAKILEIDGNTLTGTGLGVGTPEYMAPEQWRGQVVLQTDIYALGIVLFEMLTGKKPYTADTPAQVAILQATKPLPHPSLIIPGLSTDVENIILKMLAYSPNERFESMEDFRNSLIKLFIRSDYQDETICENKKKKGNFVPKSYEDAYIEETSERINTYENGFDEQLREEISQQIGNSFGFPNWENSKLNNISISDVFFNLQKRIILLGNKISTSFINIYTNLLHIENKNIYTKMKPPIWTVWILGVILIYSWFQRSSYIFIILETMISTLIFLIKKLFRLNTILMIGISILLILVYSSLISMPLYQLIWLYFNIILFLCILFLIFKNRTKMY